jgi:hypothetical protein
MWLSQNYWLDTWGATSIIDDSWLAPSCFPSSSCSILPWPRSLRRYDSCSPPSEAALRCSFRHHHVRCSFHCLPPKISFLPPLLSLLPYVKTTCWTILALGVKAPSRCPRWRGDIADLQGASKQSDRAAFLVFLAWIFIERIFLHKIERQNIGRLELVRPLSQLGSTSLVLNKAI